MHVLRDNAFPIFFLIQTETLLECTLSRYTLHILTQALMTPQNLYMETHNGTYLLQLQNQYATGLKYHTYRFQWIQGCQLSRIWRDSHAFDLLLTHSRN